MKILVSVCLVILAVVFESEALQCYVCDPGVQGCPDPNSSDAGIIEDNVDFKTCFKMDVTTGGETYVARGGELAQIDLPEVCNDATVRGIKETVAIIPNSAVDTRLDKFLENDDITLDTPVTTCVCETDLCNDNKIDQTATTPQTPTETPQTPTETPQTPTETPQTPTETPQTPTETPQTPTETPQTPTENPQTQTETPQTPTENPQTPTETPQTPTENPQTPTETPQTPTETPQTPTENPQTPTETPQTPTETPQTSTTENGASTNTIITSMLIAGVSIIHKLLW